MGKKRLGKVAVYIISTIAIVLWGLSYIWSDRLLRLGIPVEYFVFVRTLVAGFILLIFNIIAGYNIRIRRRDSFKFLVLAACEPFVYFLCETYGIQLTESPTYSALIIAMTPLVATGAGVLFFKEKLSWLNVVGMLVCLGGLTMVTLCASTVGEYFIFGILLLIVAVFAEVGHASFTKSLSGDYKPQVIVMYQFLIGSAFLFPLFMTKGMRHFEYSFYMSWAVWEPILCLAVLCSSLAFSLWVSSIKSLGVAKSSIFQAMIPVVTAVAGVVLGSERLTKLQWCGIAVAIAGLILTQTVVKRKNC